MPNSLKNQELKYLLAFNQLAMIGPRRWQAMLAYFSDLKTAWQASPMELIKAGLEQKIVDFIIDQRSVINPDQEWEKVEEISKNGKSLTFRRSLTFGRCCGDKKKGGRIAVSLFST